MSQNILFQILQEKIIRFEERGLLWNRNGRLLEDYFGLTGECPLSLGKLADRYGITRERVRQVKEGWLRRMLQTVVDRPETWEFIEALEKLRKLRIQSVKGKMQKV